MSMPATPEANAKDIATLDRLAKLLVAVTDDARQLLDRSGGADQLRARVALAATLAARLSASLSAASRDARRVRQAIEIANEAIARAQAL